ncbi:hypothetical protein UF64_10825 [Thalassospira sp. HJ]|nr:hypothetical protein UF64_10825 [Thalassospira sp. HJ]
MATVWMVESKGAFSQEETKIDLQPTVARLHECLTPVAQKISSALYRKTPLRVSLLIDPDGSVHVAEVLDQHVISLAQGRAEFIEELNRVAKEDCSPVLLKTSGAELEHSIRVIVPMTAREKRS